MILWQFWLIFGIIVLLIDLFASTTFLVNIALGLFITSLCAYFNLNLYIQLIVLFVTSALFLIFLRPFLLKLFHQIDYDEFEDKYIGHAANVIEEVTQLSGRITIYGEEWSAKTNSEAAIPVGTNVKIIRKDGMIMIVDKI